MPDMTPSDQQLATLHRLGLATHFLSPPQDGYTFSITPQQIRDLGGIRLTSVLEDGRVVIACPEDVPEVLSRSAVEIDPSEVPDDAPAPEATGIDLMTLEATIAEAISKAMPQTESTTSDRKFELLSEAVDRMGQILQDQAQPTAQAVEPPDFSVIEQRIIGQGKHLADRLGRIDKQLTEASPAAPVDLSGIEATLQELSQRMEGAQPDIGPLATTLDQMMARLDALEAKLAEPVEPVDLTGLEAKLEALGVAPPPAEPDTTVSDGITGIQSRLDQAITLGSAEVSKILERLDALPHHDPSEGFARLEAQIAERPLPLTMEAQRPLLAEGLSRLQALEARLLEGMSAFQTDGLARQEDISTLADALPGPVDLTGITSQIAALAGALDSNQTTPEALDLSPLTDALTRIETAQNDVTNLETAIAALADPEDLDTLASKIAEALPRPSDTGDGLKDIASRLDDISLRMDAPDQAVQLDRLTRMVERMTRGGQPAGGASSSSLRQNTALSTVVTRLELVADSLSDVEDTPRANLDTIEQALGDLMQLRDAESANTQALRREIDRLAEAPAPAFDTVPLDNGLERLEGAIAALTTFEPPQINLMQLEACQTALLSKITELQTNREDLADVKRDLGQLGEALARGNLGGEGLSVLTERLEQISAGLEGLRSEKQDSPDQTQMNDFIDDLRFVVAELFASHIQATKGDVHQLAG